MTVKTLSNPTFTILRAAARVRWNIFKYFSETFRTKRKRENVADRKKKRDEERRLGKERKKKNVTKNGGKTREEKRRLPN